MKRFYPLLLLLCFFVKGFSQMTPVEWRVLTIERIPPEKEDKIFIIDKDDENGKPEGTKVIISFRETRY